MVGSQHQRAIRQLPNQHNLGIEQLPNDHDKAAYHVV
jgi:hypothetical protein